MEKLRTKPVLKLVIFAAIGAILSLGVSIYFIFGDDPIAVKVIAWVFCGIFFIIACILLWVQLFHFVVIKDNRFIRYRGFIRKSIRFSEIDKIVNKDGLFDIIVDGKRFATLSTDDKSTQQILLFLEHKHVKVQW